VVGDGSCLDCALPVYNVIMVAIRESVADKAG